MSKLACCLCVLPPLLATLPAVAEVHHDALGFRVDLPPGWSVGPAKAGNVILNGPLIDERVQIEVATKRTSSCEAMLRRAAQSDEWNTNGSSLEVRPGAPRTAIATFVFHGGNARGATLCAETSRNAGMYYSIVVPTAMFAQEWPRANAVLQSFAFEGTGGAGAPASRMPKLVTWQEPTEGAYTLQVPEGWTISGGIRRQDLTHYGDGVEAASPDGQAVVRLNDQTFSTCTIPDAGLATMPGPYGGGIKLCTFTSADRFGVDYVQSVLAPRLGEQSLQIDAVRRRPDLERNCRHTFDVVQTTTNVPRLQVRCSIAGIRFRKRDGSKQGAMLATLRVFYAPSGNSFLQGSQTPIQSSFWGDPKDFAALSELTGAMVASQHGNPEWAASNDRISRIDAAQVMDLLHAEAAQSQADFWDRMAASDERREDVNDILGNRVRLRDGRGGVYEAPAGSNYYFYDEIAARTAARPDDPVRGTDVWPSNTVDLRPLEVIR